MNLYMQGTNAYDAIERLRNGESGPMWSEIYDVEKHIDKAEILSESDDGPQFLFTDIENIRIKITKETQQIPDTELGFREL